MVKKLTRREFLKLAAAGAAVATIPAAGRLLEPVLAEQEAEYWIIVCDGSRCVAAGGAGILDTVKSVLGIDVGETTPHGKFHLGIQPCLGTCGSAPNVKINHEVYGELTPEKVKKILSELE